MKKVYHYLSHFIRQPRYFTALLLILALPASSFAQQGQLVVTDKSQKDFLSAYKLVMSSSDRDYRGTSTKMDTVLFPKYGECSIYWITAGADKGSFVVPDSVPSYITTKPYAAYNWQASDHRSIQIKKSPKKIAVFRSKLEADGHSISWEAQYFMNLFETFLYGDMVYFVNEDDLTKAPLSDTTALLIIPALNVHSRGDGHYIDSIFEVAPAVKSRITSFLAKGGTVYTEGNAAYFMQKAGIAIDVNFTDKVNSFENNIALKPSSSTNPIAFAQTVVDNKLYCSTVPKVNAGTADIIASVLSDNRPAIFALSGNDAKGGRIICNLGIPTVGGITEVEGGSRQLQWTLNTIFYAFSQNIDITRNVVNTLPPDVTGGPNMVSYDRIDTFEVHVTLRNLSANPVNSIVLKENLRNYFSFVAKISGGGSASAANGVVTFSGLSVAPHSEVSLVYTVSTPDPTDTIHSKVDSFIDYETLMAASLNTTTYSDGEGNHFFTKTHDYADIMFSARIFGDADVNWKNFLGLEYQPFKVYLIMENKERTATDTTTKYTQYIPKDVPFYWSDPKKDIPILKTPGGKFVDVLRGSNDAAHPEYDMDGDGKPDVWLDTASIFPKGYVLKDTSVYWLNPWTKKYENINHDSIIAQDTNGDGIVDIEAPGDKMRVWKVTWNIGKVNGYDYFDPYCSYELWIDPPDLVKMAAGVGHVKGTMTGPFPGMFFPYTKNIADANINDKSWTYWMEWDSAKKTSVDKQFIWQKNNNYSGYTFIDTAATHYKLNPGWGDSCIGIVPQPHEEFLAVVSLGGEEIDMYHPTPQQSLYSNIDYKTIFGEKRKTPIRTTYTYYAPLPNPLQFEYLGSTFAATDLTDKPIATLPAKGKAKLQYDLDASTEYSYYWIRNAGHHVQYNDPSLAMDGDASLGDGVFGYMIYEIPKGMGGYSITLPKKPDGTYDTDAIVSVDGKPFQKWLDNKNTGDAIEIWEDPFRYQIYVPQLLIPPALCDKNGDGVDDWRDDTGDRFQSGTGYLHDPFMKNDGQWQFGADGMQGSDAFDDLGKTHFTFHALYEGQGKEGPVDISKGGTLVVEEIFGGSPWVIFSHALTAYAQGVDYKITSEANPTSVKYGTDTVFIKHTIEDVNEPHLFDEKFDPYHVSYGYKESAITSLAGGKDPCSLLDSALSTSTLIDPKVDHHAKVTLIPAAGAVTPANPDLAGYPKDVSGTFLEVKVEVMNGTDDNWLNTTVTPVLSGLGNTKAVLTYVAYPRPLVPAHEEGGVITPGDQPGTFTTGWRFNQPEGEVLVKMGNTLNLMQPTRRGYFIFLFSIDESLKKGIYDIGFTLSGKRKHYTGTDNGDVNFAVPSVKFSIVEKTAGNKVKEYQKVKIDNAILTNLTVTGSEHFQGLSQVKWSDHDVNFSDFKTMTGTLSSTLSDSNRIEIIDLSKVKRLPNADTSKLYLLEKVAVNSYRAGEFIDLTTGEGLSYTHQPEGSMTIPGNKIVVSPYGPRILIAQKLYSINGIKVENGFDFKSLPPDKDVYIVTQLNVLNAGTDVSINTVVSLHPGPFYTVLTDSLKGGVTYENGLIRADVGLMAPGDTKTAFVFYKLNGTVTSKEDLETVIRLSDIAYKGPLNADFKYTDPSKVLCSLYDLQLESLVVKKNMDNSYHIKAVAVNRGLPANDVMFRIYPVINGNLSELSIGQQKIAFFGTGEEVTMELDYTPHNNDKVEAFAKIDDEDYVSEVLEQNNSIIKDIALSIDELKANMNFRTYPNPFTDQVHFEYTLQSDEAMVSLNIYTPSGKEVVRFINCPTQKDKHTIEWIPANLTPGNYIYKLTVKDKAGNISEIPGLLVKTDR